MCGSQWLWRRPLLPPTPTRLPLSSILYTLHIQRVYPAHTHSTRQTAHGHTVCTQPLQPALLCCASWAARAAAAAADPAASNTQYTVHTLKLSALSALSAVLPHTTHTAYTTQYTQSSYNTTSSTDKHKQEATPHPHPHPPPQLSIVQSTTHTDTDIPSRPHASHTLALALQRVSVQPPDRQRVTPTPGNAVTSPSTGHCGSLPRRTQI
jgi:hypothetical protein